MAPISTEPLRLPPAALEAINAHFRFCLPEECCGLLAGVGREVRFVYLLTNAQHSPTAFTVDPVEHFRAWKDAETRGWDLIGAFHSHPLGPPTLSLTDLALAAESQWLYLVVTPEGVRAFTVAARRADEVEIVS
ncbi:MAG: Mov34/MPN/PAD-1 family protein [Acidimicrobiia bacterium]